MASRREWVPCFNYGDAASILAGTTGQLTSWDELTLFIANAADECTFLRLKGHIVVAEGAPGSAGTIGWRVRVGLTDLAVGGAASTAGEIDDVDVAEEHFLDERFWHYDTTAQPSAGDHPYYYTFDTSSKRKLALPQALVVSFLNDTADDIRVVPFLRGLFLFA